MREIGKIKNKAVTICCNSLIISYFLLKKSLKDFLGETSFISCCSFYIETNWDRFSYAF